jgi:hypothetical protein
MSISLSNVRANQLIGGISKWWVRHSADTGYYDLGALYEASVDFPQLGNVKDSYQRPRQNALDFTAKAKLLNTEKTNMVKLLDYLFLTDTDHVIAMINGVHSISSSLLTHDPYFGLKGKLVSDADMDKSRYIEIEADRGLTLTGAYDELLMMLQTAPSVPGSQPTTDMLHAMASITRATGEVPAGFSKVEIGETPGPDQDVGVIRNGKFTAEFYGTKDSRRRTHCNAVKFDISVEVLQTALAEIIQAKDIASANIDMKITFVDGLIFTAVNRLGIQWNFNIPQDMEDSAFVKLVAQGAMVATPAGTTWENLWS